MNQRRFGVFLSAILFVVSVVAFAGRSAMAGKQQPAGQPKLVVVLVFDQLRADYLTRWEKLYGDGGFKRLMKEGAWFQNCHYPYSCTFTAAGHASVATGCSPNVHGIVGNSWYDRKLKKSIASIYSPKHRRVPAGGNPNSPSAAPIRLKAPTLADAMKAATNGKSRVVSMSFKDRSAILPGGKTPDACYWLDKSTGKFITSTYYQSDPHPWVRRFNACKPADRWFGRTWTRLRPDVDYKKAAGPDDVAEERTGSGQGRTFPHPMGKRTGKPGKQYYSALLNSPFGNDLLVDFAKEAVVAEQLGRHDVPDLLCVSFSSNDIIGHCYGPDSQEVLDTALRTDLVVRELLSFLDDQVGEGKYVVALTADHGVCPLPGVSRAKGISAQRYSFSTIRKRAQAHLQQTFNTKADLIEAISGVDVYLNRKALKAAGIPRAKAEAELAAFLKKQPGLVAAYTATELAGDIPESDELGRKVQQAFHPENSGDVIVVIKPYSLPGSRNGAGTTHGSPHAYDTHVPLLFYGAGIVPGIRRDAVTPQATAPTLAAILGIVPPKKATANVPAKLFKVPTSVPPSPATP